MKNSLWSHIKSYLIPCTLVLIPKDNLSNPKQHPKRTKVWVCNPSYLNIIVFLEQKQGKMMLASYWGELNNTESSKSLAIHIKENRF